MGANDPRFINTRDAAKLLGLAEGTLRKAVCEGRRDGRIFIPYTRIGRAIRYCLSDVLAAAQAGRVEA